MASISLRNTKIRIKDGYSKTATINQSTPVPASGDTTLTIDGFTGAVATGDTFTVNGETTSTTVHTVMTHTETGTDTTQITFTPALGAGTYADNGVITFLPHSLEVTIGEGNLQYTEHRNYDYIRDRGMLDTVKQGNDDPVDVSLDFTWEFLTAASGDPPTIEDALKQKGAAETWVTSSSDTCEPYAVNIEVDYTPPCGQEETIILSDFRWEELQHSLKDAQVAMKGKCNVTDAEITRS